MKLIKYSVAQWATCTHTRALVLPHDFSPSQATVRTRRRETEHQGSMGILTRAGGWARADKSEGLRGRRNDGKVQERAYAALAPGPSVWPRIAGHGGWAERGRAAAASSIGLHRHATTGLPLCHVCHVTPRRGLQAPYEHMPAAKHLTGYPPSIPPAPAKVLWISVGLEITSVSCPSQARGRGEESSEGGGAWRGAWQRTAGTTGKH